MKTTKNTLISTKKFSLFTFLTIILVLSVNVSFGQTSTITITNASIGGSGVLSSNNYNSGAERTWTQSSVSFGGKAITCNPASTPAGATACQYIQAQATNGVIYNTSALPGRIISIQFTGSASVASSCYGGSSRLVTSTSADYAVSGTQIGTAQTNTTYTWTTGASDNFTFFCVKRGGSAQYFSSIVITYAVPTITGTATATAFTTTYGTASSAQNFSVSGTGLTANLIATAPTGFEVSSDGTTYGSTATFTQSSGSASGTLRIRLAATAQVSGAFNSKNIVLSSTGATSVNITTSASGNAVSTKALTVTGASATSKTYDRTTTATITGSLSGIVNSDVVTLSGTGTFSQSNIGTGISVTSTSTLGGAGAGNYSLTQPTGLTANITAKALTVSGASASNKTYDGTNTATISGGTLVGVISPDAVTLSQSGTFTQTIVGTGISVTSTSLLGGADAGNYTLTQPTGLAANISTKALSISGMTAADKTYDGTNTASLSGGSLVGIVSPDVVTLSQTGTFSQSTVGTGLTVTSTSTLGGANAGNYSLTQPSGITATITQATPTINSNPSASDITLGQALSSSSLTGGSATPSGGTFAFTSPATVPGSIGIYSAAITYTPTDATNYTTASGTVNVNVNAASTPTLNALTLSSNLSSTYGTASTGISFTPSGLNLSGNITINAQSGYEVSTSLGSGYSSSISVTSGTTVYVRFSASKSAGSYNGVVFAVLSSSGATSANAVTSASGNTISPKALSISTASIASKTYDALATSGTVTPGTLSGFVGSETITVTSAVGTYADATVGTGKTATIVYTLADGTNGGLATNYTLANTTSTGNITSKTLSITAASIASKTYDATATSGTVTPGTLSGFVGTETVIISSAIGTFSDAMIGTGKTATIVYTLANGTNGGLATNYTLANTTSTGTITAKTLSITAASIASKTYDATAISGTVTPGTLSGFVGSETVTVSAAIGTYSDANVGNGKTATIVYTLADGTNGGLASNYILANTTATGNITAKALSISTASIAPKVYNASATSGTVTPGTLSGFVGSETVSISSSIGTFSDANVGTGKTATITYTLANGTNGGLATNYSLANSNATGDISQATQIVTFTSFITPITANSTITATSNFGASVTYSSSNSAVATINASTGAVTVVASGTTTITASATGSSNYTSGSVSQVLTVNPSNGSIVVFPTSWTGTPSTVNATSQHAKLNGTVVASKGTGLTGVSSSSRFNASGWSTSATLTPSGNNSYFTFTLTATSGYLINLNSAVINFAFGSSGTGPTKYGFYSSVNGFASTAAQIGADLSTASTSITFPSTGYNNLSTIEIRIYGWSASSTGGTGGFSSLSITSGNVVCSVPSTSSAISGNTTVCTSSNQTYSVTNVAGTGYTWSLPVSWTGTSTSNSISATTAATSGSGTISVTPYNSASGCTNYTASSQSFSVTNNTTPTISGTTPSSRCDEGNVSLEANASAGTVNWYAASTGGTSLYTGVSYLTSSLSATTTFYVDATNNGCTTGTRIEVIATINSSPSAPSGNTNQSFCSLSSPTIANLNASGTSVQWYEAASGGSAISSSSLLTDGTTYYATQTTNGCESTSRLAVLTSFSSSGTWIGGTSGDWNDAANWCGGIPNSTSAVVSVPVGTTITLDFSPVVESISIASGATLDLGSNSLTIADGGTITNDGTLIIGAGNVIFNGSATLSGNAITFNDLLVNGALTFGTSPTVNGTVVFNSGASILNNPIIYGASGSLIYNNGTSISASDYEWPTTNSPLNIEVKNGSSITLNSEKTIEGTMNLSNGKINLSDKNLTLGSTSTVSLGGSTCYINATSTGELRKIYNSLGSFVFPVGDATNYTPVTLEFTEGSSLNGEATDYVGVRLKNSKVTGMNSENTNVINRSWFIEPGAGVSSYVYSVELKYDDADVEGVEDEIRPVKLSSSVWQYPGNLTFLNATQLTGTIGNIDVTANTLSWSGLTSFSEFGGAGQGGALPVELLSFSASCSDKNIELSWSTASEHNSDYFIVEKSNDGENWFSISKITAAGNSNSLLNYLIKDELKSSSRNNYYKLTQFDFDGQSKTYKAITVNCENEDNTILSYPNPSNDEVNLIIVSTENKKIKITISDVNGRILLSENKSIEEGTSLFDFGDVLQQSGVYFITVEDEIGKLKTIRHLQN